jgi:6-pyruvoyltetrahydropterin/6-carboxytetrahydropterin synthase
MRATISKVFRFEAAHHLPNHDGKCRNPHGHSYKVVVHCEGPIKMGNDDPQRGMVVDFADVKMVWETELAPLFDHKDLNETLDELVPETTAECLAVFICAVYREKKFPVKDVEVWETETSNARVTASEVWVNGEQSNRTRTKATTG